MALFFASGCVKSPEAQKIKNITFQALSTADKAVAECQKLCRAKDFEFLNQSPCLSNDLLGDGNWVCDIAHKPRIELDNLPENQCAAWRNGTASHFVELDPYCSLIKIR